MLPVLFQSQARLTLSRKILTTQPASLVAYWKFDEPSGTTGADSVIDSAPGKTHMTPSNITFGTDGVGQGRTAASFNGTTSYASLAGDSLSRFNSAFTPGEFTICMWLKAVTLGLFGRLLFFSTALVDNYIYIERTVSNFVLTKYLAGGVSKSASIQPAVITNWHHVAVTVSKLADELKLYIDGVQVDVTQTGLGTWSGALGSVVVGAQNTVPSNPYKGIEQHLAVWKVALSASDIQNLGRA